MYSSLGDSGFHSVEDFVSRAWLADAIEIWRQGGGRLCAITGAPGTGKTAFITEIAQSQLAAGDNRWLAAAWSCAGGRANPRRAITAIAEQLCETVPGFHDALLAAVNDLASSARDILVQANVTVGFAAEGSDVAGVRIVLHEASVLETVDRLLRRPLHALRPDQEPVVALDGLDEAVTWDATPTLVEVILHHIADLPLRFVVTSRNDPRIWQASKDIQITRLDIEHDAPTGINEVAEYVHLRLAKKVPDKNERSLAAAKIQAASQGNFLYAFYVTGEIREGTRSSRSLDRLPDGLEDLYSQFIERELRPRGNAAAEQRWTTAIRPCLELLLCCRADGFSADQIARIAGLPTSMVYDFYRITGQYLRETEGGIWTIYHPSFAQFLCGGPHPLIILRDGESKIADSALAEWCDIWDQCADNYTLWHLPSHLLSLAGDHAS